jgi:hypothetical protein
MLDEYKTPDSFWVKAINTACHAANRLYLHKYLNKTPYEIITNKKPSVHYFRVFGCKCFILNKCDNPPRKILYYRLNQSTLVIK